MRNPLRKRIGRELLREWKKYLALSLLLVLSIGFVSGMFVANDSMESSALEAYEKYAIEDGHFELKDKATDFLLDAFVSRGITIYPQFYKDLEEDYNLDGVKDAKIRVFQMRESVNRACLMDGRFPETADEIVIDRMHADNQNIKVGDVIRLSGAEKTVTGLVAFADYSTLYENNSDVMFDALTFDIAAMTAEGYASLDGEQTWQYAFVYNDRPKDVKAQKERSDTLAEQLAVLAATGGMLDRADEADALKADIDNWKAYLEDVAARADALQARRDALQARVSAMTPEALYASAAEITAETDALVQEANALEAESDQIEDAKNHLEALEPYEEHQNELTDYVPEYANQAIHFAPEDMGSDKAMGEVLLIVLVVVLAFIFALTESSTITEEAAVIGTLRASGYTRSELLRHYLAVPAIITLVSAVIGNVLGYSVFKNVVVSMYYHSYSLPTYQTRWNGDAFIKTTLYPMALMLAVNLLVIARKLRFTPLQFLRRDLSASKRKRALKLPNWRFLRRFRMRILLQNGAAYLTLFLGIFFVMVLLAFSIGMPATLKNYQDNAAQYVLADYQYLLRSTEQEDGEPLQTSEPTAERFSISGLKTVDGVHIGEDVTVYGSMENSRYFTIPDDLAEGQCIASADYMEKFGLQIGQTVLLKERYTEKTHEFTIAGSCDLPGTIAIVLPNEAFNRAFDLDSGSFTGFLASHEITDLPSDQIASVITVDDALKMAKQLDHSIGSYMDYFAIICMAAAVLLIFLLTKLIIERSAVSISMVKVLGYTNREISALYIRITTIVVVLSSIASAFLAVAAVKELWKAIMYDMSGWFSFYSGAEELIKITLMVVVSYLLVALLDLRRIRKIPLTEALKNAE